MKNYLSGGIKFCSGRYQFTVVVPSLNYDVPRNVTTNATTNVTSDVTKDNLDD